MDGDRIPANFCVCMSYFANILNCLSNINKHRSFFNRWIIRYIILNWGEIPVKTNKY